MFTKDLIWGNSAGFAGARDKLDDKVLPYGWEDAELLGYLNLAYFEWCRESHCIRDDVTASVCQIPLLAGMLAYPMSPKITFVHNGWLSSGRPHMEVKDEIWLDRNAYAWRTSGGDPRFILPDYSLGYLKVIRFPLANKGYYSGAFTFTAPNTISQTGTLFSTNLVAADQVVISGTLLNGTTAVPVTFTVATVATDSFTVTSTIVNESAAAGIIRKVVDTLNLSVDRVPVTPLALAGWETQALEIREDYQPYLIDGILREAYQKQDAACLDVNKSKEHAGYFEKNKAKTYNEIQRLRHGTTVLVPNRGRL
jgi:hypothetical protein